MPCCKQDSLCSHSFGNILFEAIRHAVKALAEISEKIKLLPPSITDSISALKTEILNEKTISLDVEEALIALSISAAMTKDEAQRSIRTYYEAVKHGFCAAAGRGLFVDNRSTGRC